MAFILWNALQVQSYASLFKYNMYGTLTDQYVGVDYKITGTAIISDQLRRWNDDTLVSEYDSLATNQYYNEIFDATITVGDATIFAGKGALYWEYLAGRDLILSPEMFFTEGGLKQGPINAIAYDYNLCEIYDEIVDRNGSNYRFLKPYIITGSWGIAELNGETDMLLTGSVVFERSTNSVVPEPSTLVLIGLSTIIFPCVKRRIYKDRE
jgi:hypothetical protein